MLELLPPELFAEVASYLRPLDLEALSETSRYCHDTFVSSKLFNQHKAFKEYYGKVTCGDGCTHGSIDEFLIIKLAKQPGLADYVKQLTIFDWFVPFVGFSHPSMISDISSGLGSLSTMAGKEIWEQIRYLSNEAFVLPLLLLILRNLRVLRIAQPSSRNLATALSAIRSVTPQKYPFSQHLRVIEFSEKFLTATPSRLGEIVEYAKLPSVKEVFIQGHRSTDEHCNIPESLETSNAESITFAAAPLIDAKLMHRFLRYFPRLKTFTWQEACIGFKPGDVGYENWDRGIFESRAYEKGYADCFTIGNSLQRYSAESLRELTITCNAQHRGEVCIGDISAFSNLASLSIYQRGLCNTVEHDMAVLPISLQRLQIHCILSPAALALVHRFCLYRITHGNLPGLQTLEIDGAVSFISQIQQFHILREEHVLPAVCEQRGIKLISLTHDDLEGRITLPPLVNIETQELLS